MCAYTPGTIENCMHKPFTQFFVCESLSLSRIDNNYTVDEMMSQQQCCPVTRCRTNWIEINNHFFPWPFREIQCYFHTTCMVMNAIRHGSAKSTMHIIYRHQLQCMLHDKMTIESTNRTDSYMYVYTVYLNCQFQREIICVRTLSLSHCLSYLAWTIRQKNFDGISRRSWAESSGQQLRVNRRLIPWICSFITKVQSLKRRSH